MTDIVESGSTPRCSACFRPIIGTPMKMGFCGDAYHVECTLPPQSAAIERLREENERYRIALLGICRPVWSRPPIDSEAANTYAHICQEMITIAQFALAATTANTAANTSDAVTNENDATS